jgi:Matrixin
MFARDEINTDLGLMDPEDNWKINVDLDHIAKHEFGHALGLGHAHFPHSIMYPDVDETLTEISACELDSVVYANHLNSDYVKEKEIFHPMDADDFECKEE